MGAYTVTLHSPQFINQWPILKYYPNAELLADYSHPHTRHLNMPVT